MSAQISLTIDGQAVAAQPGQTVLNAAAQAGISIPHLCAYPNLEPFGGCRMCIVEIDGLRGFPTACTIPASEGMVVHTRSAQVAALRRDTLQLILSEHPSNCLFCEEAHECGAYMATTRKGDVVTGCRSCSKDGQCELQDVIAEAGLTEINLPFHYRGMPVEKYDPFYDRDYNLCILCGRCVRVCQEVRLADVLTFKQRGPTALVGPAFDRSHIEAGCEFCGDCVSACPTGALAEKTLKWAGKPESAVATTCPLCSLGCELKLQVRGSEVMGTLPGEDPQVNQGQLCVKGRFGVYELLNNPDRLTHPLNLKNGFGHKLSWKMAVDLAAEKLAACPPEGFAMRVSMDCTNEDLYVARKFGREVMHSDAVTTRATEFYGRGLAAMGTLMQAAAPFASLKKASAILAVGLDGRYGWSVVAVELRRAVRRGARLASLFPREHSLSTFAERWLALDGPALARALKTLVRLTAGKEPGLTGSSAEEADLAAIARALVEADAPVIIVGPEYLASPESAQILEAIGRLARQAGAGMLPLAPQSNLVGAMKILPAPQPLYPFGYPEVGPSREGGTAVEVLYLVGETPSPEDPAARFTIYQNFAAYEGPNQPDLTLPAAAFAEVDGTTINLEGRTRPVHKAVEPPGEALPDWQILCRIAQKLGAPGFDYPDAAAIQRDMAELVAVPYAPSGQSGEDAEEDLGKENLSRRAMPADAYRGFPLTTWVEGLKALTSES